MQQLSGKYTFDQLMSALQGTFGCRTSYTDKTDKSTAFTEMCLFQLRFRFYEITKKVVIALKTNSSGEATYRDLMTFVAES